MVTALLMQQILNSGIMPEPDTFLDAYRTLSFGCLQSRQPFFDLSKVDHALTCRNMDGYFVIK